MTGKGRASISHEGSSDRPKVLIVDDREANLIALDALLSDLGCDVVRASNGNEALRQLLKHEFALVLLDVQMPEMDGYEVARYSRENPTTRDVPIIFVTATHATDESALRGYDKGAVDYLFKPINPHVLKSKVRVFLDLYMSRKRIAAEVEAHRETAAALERSNAALRHFTHAASHDLRAPLRTMNGFLDALDEEARGQLGDEALQYLQWSRQAAARMRDLLDSLLAYSRLARPSEATEVSCSEVVAQVRADLADRVTASRATIEVGPLPVVRGDRSRIYELFLNLISNALKFTRPGEPPRVRVTAEDRGRQHVFCVVDHGIGLPADAFESIFEPFSRLHSQDKYEGSGLGLPICRQIVEQHGGTIWAEANPESGTRFCFTLPAQR